MELTELSKRLGVKKIVISHYNSFKLKDEFTIVVNDDITIFYLGKTAYIVPTSSNGVGKTVSNAGLNNIITSIKDELDIKIISYGEQVKLQRVGD